VSISIEISVGELLDKLTILQIKSEKITDQNKLENINKELEVLSEQWEASAYSKTNLEEEIKSLKEVNEALWRIEDEIRDKEKEQAFDEIFVKLARDVYFTNDRRADIKKIINAKTGSDLIEEKSYSDYGSSN
jgi:cupin superfamily acireductone dioxygenase involved in methionine salvage